MDMNYIAEYGTRQALLDLAKVDVSKFSEGTVDSGKINDQLVGINAGVNSVIIFANPAIFEKAKMDVPDDTTWTWDSMIETWPRRWPRRRACRSVCVSVFDVGRPVQCVRAPERPGAVQRRRRHLRARRRPGLVRSDGQGAEGQGDRHAAADQRGRLAQAARPERDRRLGRAAYAALQLQPAARGHQGRRDRALDPAVPEPDRQGHRPQGVVQGLAVVLRLGQDQEPRRRRRVHRLVRQLPRVAPTSTWRSAVFRATPRSWRRSRRSWTRRIRRSSSTSRTSSPRSATPRSPRRPAVARRSPPPCSGTRPMCCSGGPARPTPRRSSWTR